MRKKEIRFVFKAKHYSCRSPQWSQALIQDFGHPWRTFVSMYPYSYARDFTPTRSPTRFLLLFIHSLHIEIGSITFTREPIFLPPPQGHESKEEEMRENDYFGFILFYFILARCDPGSAVLCRINRFV
jgi:hypothetical protein